MVLQMNSSVEDLRRLSCLEEHKVPRDEDKEEDDDHVGDDDVVDSKLEESMVLKQ